MYARPQAVLTLYFKKEKGIVLPNDAFQDMHSYMYALSMPMMVFQYFF